MARKKKSPQPPVAMDAAIAEPVEEVAAASVEPPPEPIEADELISESIEYLIKVDGVTYHHNRKLADGRRVYQRLRSA